jgi:hypothetical protein
VNTLLVTNVLLLIVAALLFELVHPAWAPLVWLALGVFAVVSSISWLKARHEQRKAMPAAKARDEEEFKMYRAEHQAIRAKYDPEHKWNEATSTPRAYREEIAELNELHSAMLKRRFGEDF